MAVSLTAPRRRGGVTPVINVTPLVDVVLVLLIIFMVIAPQLEAGDRVELPAVANVDKASKLDAVTLTVTASQRLLLEKDEIVRDGLVAALDKAHKEAPEKRLVIKGDQNLPYSVMRGVFADAQKVGFPGVALTVDQKKSKGGN